MSGNTSRAAIASLFSPERIALVGATDRSGWSWNTFRNLSDFPGEVVCVNPRGGLVHGTEAVTSLREAEADLAFIMVPQARALEAVAEAADCGVSGIVLLTDGFAEAGAEGQARHEELLRLADAHGLTILGPNGIGFINTHRRTQAFGLPVEGQIPVGGVALVLQSGGLADSVIRLAQARNVGVSHLISMGNEAVVGMTDVIDHLIDDPQTSVIALFVEAIRDADAFLEVAERANRRGKPIVALKVGRSEVSARSAMAHTGAVVGDDRVVDAVFRQLNVIRVNSLEDLITTSGFLADFPDLPGRRMAFVTGSGGACDVSADRCADEGLELPALSAGTVEMLGEILPPSATAHNPLDVTGYVVVSPTLLPQAITAVAEDPSVDVVVCTVVPARNRAAGEGAPEQDISGLADAARRSPVPVVFMDISGTDVTTNQREKAAQVGLPTYLGGIDRGITALGRAVTWAERRRQTTAEAAATQGALHLELPAPVGTEWSEVAALSVLRQAGVPVVPHELVTDPLGAEAAAARVGLPVALKIVSPDIAHKSDVGGVRLGLGTAAEVAKAYEEMYAAVSEACPGARLEGAMVAPLRSPDTDLFVGVVRDPQWGQVLALGLGGIWIEVLGDSSTRRLPVSARDVHEMLSELKASPVLDGIRGALPVDREALVDAVLRLTRVAQALGDRLDTIEVNPLRVGAAGVEALDALVTWQAVPDAT